MIKINKNFDDIPNSIRRLTDEYIYFLTHNPNKRIPQKYLNLLKKDDVNSKIKLCYHNKCSYCETSLLDRFSIFGNYRPKSKYPELIFEWSNILLICDVCNIKKSNKFPIKGVKLTPLSQNISLEDRKNLIAVSPFLLQEKPLLLHPDIDNPDEYFTLNENGLIIPKNNNERAKTTIEILDLNRNELVIKRIKIINDFLNRINRDKLEKNIKNIVNDIKSKASNPSTEFSFVYKQMIKNFKNFFNVDLNGITEKNNADSNLKNELINILSNTFSIVDTHNVNPVIGADKLSEELSTLIQNLKNEKGQMIGIFGKWGRGKTFLVELIWRELEKTDRFIKVDFHAWKYQDTPATWAYLYEVLSKKYYRNKGGFTEFVLAPLKRINLNIKKFGLKNIIFLLLSIYVTINIGLIPFNEKIAFLKNLGWSIVLLLVILYFKYKDKAINLIEKYTNKHSHKNLLGFQAEIGEDIKILLKTWLPDNFFTVLKDLCITPRVDKKILLFIDDIDRCSENKIIDIIDSLRVMLEDKEVAKRVIVIVAVDENILRMAIEHKYSKMSIDKNNIKTLTREYIDKLFIFGIKLGNLSYQDKTEILGVYCDIYDEILITPTNEVNEIGLLNQIEEINETESSNQTEEINETESSNQTNNEDIINYYSITSKEKEILDKELISFEQITPRKIRIYYYRYLFAKRLFFNNLDIDSDSSKLKVLQILAKFLVIFNNVENYKKLENIKDKIFNSNNKDEALKELNEILDDNIKEELKSCELEVLKEIINIVELLIPY